MNLSRYELERYNSQLICSAWGVREQNKLRQSSVIIDSELECLAYYLAAAGIGKITLSGDAKLSSNLKKSIYELNPEVKVQFFNPKEAQSADFIAYGANQDIQAIPNKLAITLDTSNKLLMMQESTISALKILKSI